MIKTHCYDVSVLLVVVRVLPCGFQGVAMWFLGCCHVVFRVLLCGFCVH